MNGTEAFALRGRLFWFEADPEIAGPSAQLYCEDGLLLIRDGLIERVGEASLLLPELNPDIPIVDHRPHLVMPGFIDAHLHFPQTQVIASYGEQLLDWLNRYTFVEEQRFAEAKHAASVASFFVDTLLSHGTTCAVAFGSVHRQSVEALLDETARRGMRMIAGKVMMDRNAPPALRDTAQSGYDDTLALITKWHGKARQGVAIAPRFAITSTPAQLEAAGALARAHPDCLIETHLSENAAEIAETKRLFPEARDYLDVYDRYGLVGPKTLFGHCLHLEECEKARMAEAGAVAVHCPTSNLFLGSGLFDWRGFRQYPRPIPVALATDIGAGTSYSMLVTAGEAYKVAQLRGHSLSPQVLFHAITRGNALALGLGGYIGRFAPGMEADLVVLDSRATPAMAHRMERSESLTDELFVLATMGDAQAIAATYVFGRRFSPADAA